MFRQAHKIDYNETYGAVAKFSSICRVLASVAHPSLGLHQINVITAFPHGEVEEIIYMEVPNDAVVVNIKTSISKRVMGLYGLGEALRR